MRMVLCKLMYVLSDERVFLFSVEINKNGIKFDVLLGKEVINCKVI